MKAKLYSVITLLTFIALVFVSNGFTQQTLLEPSVRLIYFLPNDRPARPDRIEAFRQLIKDAQEFYADQMEHHGFGRKTFRVETDTDGEPVVHHIDGQFTEEYYYKEGTGYKIWKEIREHFDNFQHIYFTVIDLSSEMLHNGQTCGEASLTYFPQGEERIQWRMRNITQQEEVVSGGFAVIPASGDCFEDNRGYRHRLGTLVHELGHAFGLDHDFREGHDSDYVMAYGSQSRLSMCAAEWLSVSRFFNTRPTLHNDPAEIQLLSSMPTNQDEISLRFEVTDPHGLHQAQLLVADFFAGDGWGPHRLFSCKQLNGETSIVESVIKAAELIDTVTLQITDVSGQITWATFFVDVASLPPPPLTFTPNDIAPQTFIIGTPVNLTLPSATGGTAPYTYTLSPIPAGLQFDTATQVLNGTPTTAGTTTATYTATDAANVSASLTFTIEVTEGVILDVNRDGQVTVVDLAIVALFYGTQVPADISLPADVNVDGVVDILDLTAVAQGIDAASDGNGLSLQAVEAALLEAAEQAADTEAIAEAPIRFGDQHQHALSLRIPHDNVVDALADVKHLATGDVRLRKGVTMLAGLLHLLSEMVAIPEQTALLPNYPNPFNPETWLPYQLATPASVTLSIYSVDGRLVRTLDVGHQPVGVYRSKSRAAYWDGKNSKGETVASGLYFYTLRTGDFAATRKLIIRK